MILIVDDTLRFCMLDFGGSLEDYLHLVEIVYSNSYQTCTKMTPFKTLYGRKYRLLIYWNDDIVERKLHRPEIIMQIVGEVNEV